MKDNKKENKKTVIGILAHVDAGKTTLCEGLLYLTGNLRKQGRVDHGDAFLDTYDLEKKRGITIFSKQAVFKLRDKEITLLDTPGHADFSAEMERTLRVLDYAILVISGSEGVQEHVRTLKRLLMRYRVPVFIFVNKMDMPGTDRKKTLSELREKFSEDCVDFSDPENIAACDEELMEGYLENGSLNKKRVAGLIRERKIFPCYFGSALRLEGVDEFISGLEEYTEAPAYSDEFSAVIYKISRDKRGKRLTHMKITGGSLRVKTLLKGETSGGEKWEEKADEIRIYSGEKYILADEAEAGTVCAVTGLSHTQSGDVLGESYANILNKRKPYLEPVLSYSIRLPEGTDVHEAYKKLCMISEEIPELGISWDEGLREIRARLMGEIQTEVLKGLVKERFGFDIDFDDGGILYKETINNTVEGVGHFEPLRHYAEVHLLLEPLERGSGLQFDTACSTDSLALNWQRLVLTHLTEKKHRGVLTGSEITDMRITLVAGRAHEKHTEGGDFREATYRALRQGLKKAESVLLEPWYEYSLELPQELIGRAMTDISGMSGSFSEPEDAGGGFLLLRGEAPVSEMRSYRQEVISYSGGRGKLSCIFKGYAPAHNAEEVISAKGYDSEKDLENPTGSVFCANGGGYYVPWYEVDEKMHVESVLEKIKKGGIMYPDPADDPTAAEGDADRKNRESASPRPFSADEKELEEIFLRTYGESKRDLNLFKKTEKPETGGATKDKVRSGGGKAGDCPAKTFDPGSGRGNIDGSDEEYGRKNYLLVDGYNIIFAWDELKELAAVNIDGARTRLMDILSNYQGYRKMTLILVFDAYKVPGNPGNVERYHNIYVVYTKEAETADQYIAKTVSEMSGKYNVTVATSDSLVQLIIFGKSAVRMSARELKAEVESTNTEIRDRYLSRESRLKNKPDIDKALREEEEKAVEDRRKND